MLEPLAVNAGRSESSCAGRLSDSVKRLLLCNQNDDGGWPYQPGLQSAVEPTCWAVIALKNHTEHSAATGHGLVALKAAQLPDGSWPTRPGQRVGCWATSLATLTLFLYEGGSETVKNGVAWLCNAWPAEGTLWWQVRNWLRPTGRVTRQDSSLRGWSWTPGAASWVEPTAYGLLLLNAIPDSLHPPQAAKRRRLGEAMLYDRVCPGGGWNSGNPQVYGVAGERRVGPTVWALLALREYASRSENQQSLEWLEGAWPRISGPLSLSLAHLCLESYGRAQPGFEARLAAIQETNGFLGNVLAAAISLIALSPEENRPLAGGGFRRRAS